MKEGEAGFGERPALKEEGGQVKGVRVRNACCCPGPMTKPSCRHLYYPNRGKGGGPSNQWKPLWKRSGRFLCGESLCATCVWCRCTKEKLRGRTEKIKEGDPSFCSWEGCSRRTNKRGRTGRGGQNFRHRLLKEQAAGQRKLSSTQGRVAFRKETFGGGQNKRTNNIKTTSYQSLSPPGTWPTKSQRGDRVKGGLTWGKVWCSQEDEKLRGSLLWRGTEPREAGSGRSGSGRRKVSGGGWGGGVCPKALG